MSGEPAGKNYEDVTLKWGKNEKFDYKVIDEDLWEFLHARYGGVPIKRFYRHNSYGGTTCDVKLASLPLNVGFVSGLNEIKQSPA